MNRVLLFLLMIFTINTCYAGDKPSKIAKLIYFQGKVDKNKNPIGFGKLILKMGKAEFCITGDFLGGTITNASYGDLFTGTLSYSIDKENCSITIGLDDININSALIGHQNLGKIKFERFKSYMVAFEDITHVVKNAIKNHTLHDPDIYQFVRREECVIHSDLEITIHNGVKLQSRFINEDFNHYYFADGSEYHKYSYAPDKYITKDGDIILIKDGHFAAPTKIVSKNGIVIILDNYRIFDYNLYKEQYKAELTGKIDFPSGDHFEGTAILNDFQKRREPFLDIISNCKSISPKQLEWYDGTFHKCDGGTVFFKEGKSKNTNKKQLDNLVSDIAYGGKISSLSELLAFSDVDYNYVESTESYVHDRIDKKARYHIFKMGFLAADHVGIQNGRCVCYVYDERTTNGKYYLTINRNRIYFNLSKSRVMKEKEVYRNGSKRDEYTYLDLGPASLIPKEKLNNVSVVFVTTSEEERISYYGVDYYGYQPVAVLIVDRNSNVIANASNMLSGGTDQYKSKSTVTVPDARPIGCFFCKGSGLDFYDHHQPCAICGGKGYVLR